MEINTGLPLEGVGLIFFVAILLVGCIVIAIRALIERWK